MDDRIKGAAKQVTGSIKEAIGMIIGDPAVQAEGAAEKAAGETQSRKGSGHGSEKTTEDENQKAPSGASAPVVLTELGQAAQIGFIYRIRGEQLIPLFGLMFPAKVPDGSTAATMHQSLRRMVGLFTVVGLAACVDPSAKIATGLVR